MAKALSKTYNEVVNGDKEKKNTEVVCCLDCFWANLHQYGNNPILAQCRKKPDYYNPKFPYKVEVASAKWICPTYKYQDRSEKSVTKILGKSA